MSLIYFILTISLLSQTYLSFSMNEHGEKSLSSKERKQRRTQLEKDFYIKWGYNIPNTIAKVNFDNKYRYIAVHSNYINNNPSLHFEIQEQDNDTSYIEKAIADSNISISTPTIDPLQARLEKLQLLEQKLIQENAEQKRIHNQRIDNIIKLTEQNASIKIENETIKEEILARKKALLQQNTAKVQPKLPTAAKKKNYIQKTHNNNALIKTPNSSQQTPNNNHIKQKFHVLRFLLKRHNVQSEAQLKKVLSEKCDNIQTDGLRSKIRQHRCTWYYTQKTNELELNFNDYQSYSSSSESTDSDEDSDESFDSVD